MDLGELGGGVPTTAGRRSRTHGRQLRYRALILPQVVSRTVSRAIEIATARRALLELNLSTCTSLAPKIGYDKAAALSKEAFATGRTVRDVAREMKVLPEDELNRLLDYRRMTEPDA